MSGKILIVDDDRQAVDFFRRSLERAGYQAICAYDGAEAKALIESFGPDLIILDLVMPNIDGWGVLCWMRDIYKKAIPTVIISAKEELDDMKKGYNLDADAYLVKPLDYEEVIRAVRAVLSVQRA